MPGAAPWVGIKGAKILLREFFKPNRFFCPNRWRYLSDLIAGIGFTIFWHAIRNVSVAVD
jgi:hypothetical protein